MRLSVRESDEESLWAIVLAGGEGTRLRSVTRELYGQARPKQYAVLSGTRSLLLQTLDRVARLVPPRRTIVVTLASHAGYLTAELADLPGMTVLAQPCDRGTAAGVLLPAHWIRARDPRATVVVFPTDHFILEETRFMRQVAEAAHQAREHPEWLVLLGSPATEPERDYGWIEPGGRLGWEGGMPFRQVRSFLEKPTETEVRHLYELGCLWNTFVFASSASALIEAGRQAIPLLHDRFVRLTVFTGTRHEPWAMEQAYLLAPHAEFSRSILEEPSLPLAVGAIDAFSWCDLGTSERVARSLRSLGAPTPSWLTTLAEKG
jgi:mannose-1-phosphate guanylyltransferase